MKKVIVILFAVLFVMGVGLAHASPKQGGLSNKGSVLVFPKIDTRDGKETYVLLSNDNNQPVSVYCNWVIVGEEVSLGPSCTVPEKFKMPPSQTPIDSLFTLTPFQPVLIAASSGYSEDPIEVTINAFGTGNVGYLACWAVDFDGANQINFNHLSGMAYVLGEEKGYSYPAWAFQALAGGFKAPVGPAGTIKFDAVNYDAMPSYLHYIIPTLGTGPFVDIDLTMIQGKQNFTNMALSHPVTKVAWDAWNENEARYSGAGTCIYCFWDDCLDTVKMATGMRLFEYETLHTSVAHFRITGKQSVGCLPQLSDFDAERCLGTQITTQDSPLLSFATQNIGWEYLTTILPVGVAQDLTATFVWKPY